MNPYTTLKRNLLFLLGLFMVLSLHSTPPMAPAHLVNGPVHPTPAVKVVHKKASFSLFKSVKQQVKQFVWLTRMLKKKYRNDAVGSTILLALLMAAGVGLIIYLLSYAGISGIFVTIPALIAFALIIYWAVKRIRWNAQY